jgi:hypothetical protein
MDSTIESSIFGNLAGVGATAAVLLLIAYGSSVAKPLQSKQEQATSSDASNGRGWQMRCLQSKQRWIQEPERRR